MKINAVISRKPEKKFIFNNELKKTDKTLIIISITISIGIAFGNLVYIVSSDLLENSLIKHFIKFSTDINGKSLIEIFSGFLIYNLIFALCLILSGTSSIGEVIVYIFLLIKSTGIGAISAFLFSNFKTKGLGYFYLSFFPGKVVLIFGLLFLSQSCIQSSKIIKNSLNINNKEKIDKRLFYIRFLISTIIFAVSAFIDTINLKLYQNFFNLPF